MLNSMHILSVTLQERFGFRDFRPHQQEVCEAAVAGFDSLLVMPTGAGKSLCYQLPSVVRPGTALVISPLLALMEDQVAQLRARGFRADRIHSGRERADSRAACQAYLTGELEFLFIAPERLAVRGFPELLSQGQLSLIAIDEAHCISQWGHDFRPEYRMLGQRLPQLRGTSSARVPVMALTATATPRVQKDILTQLQLTEAKTFIHGFRRDNIAIAIREIPKSERAEKMAAYLRLPENRPAIVYAATRKEAEALAQFLASDFSVATYHAGLAKEQREKTQTDFMAGRCDVMVATVAFGMGIDKANIRTVVHASLPQSLEAYYQEIGRAGRDGKASTAWLMWSWADRKMHEFLLGKSYPESEVLEGIHAAIGHQKIGKDALNAQMRIDSDLFSAAVEKLWIHGGLSIDPDETMVRGPLADWAQTYRRQREHRFEQMALVTRFAESTRCRMLELVKHFGDDIDSGETCGHCDICRPLADDRREPTREEFFILESLFRHVASRNEQSTGKIHRDHFPKMPRKTFEQYLAALAREGLVFFDNRVFQKDQQSIPYRVVSASRDGGAEAKQQLLRVRLGASSVAAPKTARAMTSVRATSKSAPLDAAALARIEALKKWRLQEARQRKAPAFTILSDKTVTAIGAEVPRTLLQLSGVSGIGPKILEKHGRAILRVLSEVR